MTEIIMILSKTSIILIIYILMVISGWSSGWSIIEVHVVVCIIRVRVAIDIVMVVHKVRVRSLIRRRCLQMCTRWTWVARMQVSRLLQSAHRVHGSS